jgi:cytochrome c553
MKTKYLLISSLCLLLSTPIVYADAANAKAKSQSCVGCHGINGKSNNPKVPNIAGQKKLYLIKAIGEYRDKKRIDGAMNSMVGTLTDADIKDLAAYYSKMK